MNQYKPEGMLIRTSKNFEYTSSLSGLERALECGAILEATAILCDHNLDLHIELGARVRARIPRDEVQLIRDGEQVKDIAILTRVGKTVCFKVMGIDRGADGTPTVVLSRRAAQRECMINYIETLTPGDIIPARVTHMEGFGAFVDIGCGITSLLAIDCISVSRIDHPRARMSVGDTIYTVIRSVDERGRIYVSQKELLGTWEENASLFTEGETVRATVRSVESYGVFVELMPNLAGLAEFRADARAGQVAAVYIKSIIPEKMKIKLIIIDLRDEKLDGRTEYFVDVSRVGHIDEWRYSPPVSDRVIETRFCTEDRRTLS